MLSDGGARSGGKRTHACGQEIFCGKKYVLPLALTSSVLNTVYVRTYTRICTEGSVCACVATLFISFLHFRPIILEKGEKVTMHEDKKFSYPKVPS